MPSKNAQDKAKAVVRRIFQKEIAAARTFAFEKEVHRILKDGKGRGGSLKNALILGEQGPLNPEGLRFADEPVRHKLLDAVGDLSLLGGLPKAAVFLKRTGHHLHHAVLREWLSFSS